MVAWNLLVTNWHAFLIQQDCEGNFNIVQLLSNLIDPQLIPIVYVNCEHHLYCLWQLDPKFVCLLEVLHLGV